MKSKFRLMLWLYFLLVLANVTFGAVIFSVVEILLAAQAGSFWSSSALTTCSLFYIFAAVGASRVLTTENKFRVIKRTIAAFIALVAAFAVFHAPALQFFWVAALGTICSVFMCAIQLILKEVNEEKDGNVLNAAVFYTALWSIGAGLGPMVAELARSGSAWRYWLVYGGFVAIWCGGWRFIHTLESELSAAPQPAKHLPGDRGTGRERAPLPDLIKVAWLVGIVTCSSFSIMRVYPQYKCGVLGIEAPWPGVIMLSVNVAQGVAALLLLALARDWMYRRSYLVGFAGCGLLAMGFMFLGSTVWALCTGMILFGLFSGPAFVFFVYHAMVSPDKAPRYVGVNETISGSMALTGSALGGLLGGCGVNLPFVLIAFLLGALLCGLYRGHPGLRP